MGLDGIHERPPLVGVRGLIGRLTIRGLLLGGFGLLLVLWLVSPEIARTAGIDVARLNLVFLEMFALTVALGLRYLGVLLMGSLIIIPAATAKRLARTLTQMLAYAVAAAVVATIVGTIIANLVDRPPGPVIISAAAVGFLASLLKRRT